MSSILYHCHDVEEGLYPYEDITEEKEGFPTWLGILILLMYPFFYIYNRIK